MLGGGTLVFGYPALALGCLRGLYGTVLGFQGVLPLLLGMLTHALGHDGLSFCCLALLVADAALLEGYLLHLGIDALHDGRLLLLPLKVFHLRLQALRPS